MDTPTHVPSHCVNEIWATSYGDIGLIVEDHTTQPPTFAILQHDPKNGRFTVKPIERFSLTMKLDGTPRDFFKAFLKLKK